MKNTIYFILGICLVVLTSASTVSIMTVKPATPKYIMVKSFRPSLHLNADVKDIGNYIQENTQNGWILKSNSISVTNGYVYAIVVMEKY